MKRAIAILAVMSAAAASAQTSPVVIKQIKPTKPVNISILTRGMANRAVQLDPSITNGVPLTITISGPGAVKINGKSCTTKPGKTQTICSRTVTKDSPATFEAIPAPGGQFGGWAGPCAGTKPSCTFTPTGQSIVAAVFLAGASKPTVPLTVSFAGGSSEGLGIWIKPTTTLSCTAAPKDQDGSQGFSADFGPPDVALCSTDIAANDVVTIQLYKTPNSLFAGQTGPLGQMAMSGVTVLAGSGAMLGGDCAGHVSGDTCMLTVSTPRTVIVTPPPSGK